MLIEVFTPDEPLGELEEVWVRVLSNEVVDWPSVRDHLTPQQAEVMRGFPLLPTSYFPSFPDGSEHSYPLEDHWVFRKATI